VQVGMREEQFPARQFHPVGDTDISMWPPGRVTRRACIIDSWVPTASMTECAPSPLVRSLMRATPSFPRSVTMSVAPNSNASFWRGSWRLIAMTRSAPSCLAARTARRPTAPSPTTATSYLALLRRRRRRTSQCRARLRRPASPGQGRRGRLGGSDQGAVSQRYAEVLGLSPEGAHRLAVHARALVTSRQISQVLSLAKKLPTTNCPGFTVRTSLPTSSTMPTYSWPSALSLDGFDASVGPQVRTAHAGGRHLMMGRSAR